jgi:hypothetical protein
MTTPATPATPPVPSAPPAEQSKVKTFFEHIGEWLEDHLGEASSFEHTAATALGVTAPLLEQLVGEVAGEAVEAKVQSVVTIVQNDLNNTSALLNGAEAGDATHSVAGFLTDAQNALGTLLADADVKNSAKVAKITAIANTVLGEFKAIAAAIPKNFTSPVVGAKV